MLLQQRTLSILSTLHCASPKMAKKPIFTGLHTLAYKFSHKQKYGKPCIIKVSRTFKLLQVAGLEPARCCHRGILSPLRLPIPPHLRTLCLSHFRVKWAEVDSNHRSNLQQIYSLSPLATRESAHSSNLFDLYIYTTLHALLQAFFDISIS